jgi:hypothetical protein
VQPDQGLAHRRAAHAEVVGQLLLQNLVAGLVTVFENALLDGGVGFADVAHGGGPFKAAGKCFVWQIWSLNCLLSYIVVLVCFSSQMSTHGYKKRITRQYLVVHFLDESVKSKKPQFCWRKPESID